MKKSINISCIGAGLLAFCSSALGATIDLTTVGTSGTINGAQFIQGNGNSGTGLFPAFVQISGSGPGDDIREAYNTTVNNTLDNGSSATFNHEIRVNQLPIVSTPTGSYYAFLLDINEVDTASDRYLSLDAVQIFTSTTPNQSTETFPLALGSLRYDMDAVGNNTVLLNYTLNPGSGQYDMELLVPTANFLGALPTDFVYLYSQFGALGTVGGRNYGVSDGFEEWSLNPTTTVIQVPDGGATLMLLGASLAALGAGRRFRKF